VSDDPLQRLVDAVAEVTEDEVAALLSTLGVQRGPEQRTQVASRTPLPGPGSSSRVHSEVEWV
jgi:GMP synthase PP-ATPase subunit